MTSPLEEHEFISPNGGPRTLVIGPDRASTGVRHEGCDHLAEVEAELDVAYCSVCGWQCRISGAWYFDLLDASREALAATVIEQQATLEEQWKAERDRAGAVMGADFPDLQPPEVDEDDPAVQAGLAAIQRLIGTFRSEPSGMAYIIGAIDAARAAAGWVPWWMEQWGVDCANDGCGNAEPGPRKVCRECMRGEHLIGLFMLKRIG